jgi:squalene-hopene/tetraprenyl-beta-curcumene cyclase
VYTLGARVTRSGFAPDLPAKENVVRTLRLIGLLATLALMVLPVRAADDKVGPDPKDVKALRERAHRFLQSKQSKDGSFSANFYGPGPTALVVAALARNGYRDDDPVMKKAVEYLSSKVQKDGGIYEKRLANYTTCVAIMALQEANSGGRFDTILRNAAAFLKKIQHDDPANKDIRLGGVGYGAEDKRADLSNTQMFVEALIKAGVPKDDPAIQRALKFITRCQNFPDKEKGNDQPFAAKATRDDRGGFVYTPLDSDDRRHKTAEGGLRSQGAMTYAGLKSFLYAGVKKDDPRVRAALDWIGRHYTLEENTGMKQAGLYYYYSTFAKAMHALGEDHFKDARGTAHDWRKELFEALAKRQNATTGSFVNKGDRTFGEQDANLATAFALLSLSYTLK